MGVFILAAEAAHLAPFVGVLLFGIVMGVFGHIINSRTMIVTAIMLIGLTSVYFSFILQPGSG